jgi:hypothetical protein
MSENSEIPWDKRPARPLAAWHGGLAPGLYRIHWRDGGGSSLAAIGVLPDGRRWIGACNWVGPCEDPIHKLWTNIEKAEPIALLSDEEDADNLGNVT